MLPSGRLAKHGYTTKWGFFSGVCTGSGHLPFEQSTDAIEAAVTAVKCAIVNTAKAVANFENLAALVNDGSEVWVHIYANGSRQWVTARLHDFSTDRTSYAPNVVSKCSFSTIRPVYDCRDAKTLTNRIQAYSEAWQMHTIQEWARFLNRKYSATLVKANESRQAWVKWQSERVATWAPAPLTAR